MKALKDIIALIMFVTGAALVILAAFSAFFDAEFPFVSTVFEIFAANILIILGLFVRRRFEIPYIILEYLIDITYIIAVLIVSGLIFNWKVPTLFLVVAAVVIYILAMIIFIMKLKKDTNELNDLLQKRKKKQADTAS